MADVWQSAPYTGGALLVLLALADYANKDDGICWPRVDTLATKVRMKPRQVQNILKQLQADGAISIQRGGGRGMSNIYKLEMGAQRVQSTAPFPEKRAHSSKERVQSTTEKGAICGSAIRKESSLEPSLEPSRDFNFKDRKLQIEEQLQNLPQNRPANPDCDICGGGGLVPSYRFGMPKMFPCACRNASQLDEGGSIAPPLKLARTAGCS
jgi:hypothetical protein